MIRDHVNILTPSVGIFNRGTRVAPRLNLKQRPIICYSVCDLKLKSFKEIYYLLRQVNNNSIIQNKKSHY